MSLRGEAWAALGAEKLRYVTLRYSPLSALSMRLAISPKCHQSTRDSLLPVATRRLSPLCKQLVMLDRGVRACSCFDRLTHHAHGHGAYIAGGGGFGSPFGGRAQADGRCRVGGVCHQVVTTPV